MFSWVKRPRNWIGETRKQELSRRVEAAESSTIEAHLRINELENRLNLLYAIVSPLEREREDDDTL